MVGPSINSPNFSIKLPSSTIKFLCSYAGKILPRFQDGKLRYHGGHTRVLAVERSISFHELVLKLAEICGESVSQFRCQLPTEDLDALVSVTSDEDLANIIEEYDRFTTSSSASGGSIKIRAFISVPKRSSLSTTPPAGASSSSSSSSTSNGSTSPSVSLRYQRLSRCHMSPLYHQKPLGKLPPQYAYPAYGNTRRQMYLVHNGNYWQ